MELNFKNILVESIIDDLETLTKMDKEVLKFIHNSMGRETFQHTIGNYRYEMDSSDALKINDLINIFGLKDYNYVIANIEKPNPLNERLKDLSDESLEKYFDFIIEQLQDEFEEWDEDIRYYYNEVEPQREN